jgi:hypothetical protein
MLFFLGKTFEPGVWNGVGDNGKLLSDTPALGAECLIKWNEASTWIALEDYEDPVF